jgi:DNA-binding NtrC family response regulator
MNIDIIVLDDEPIVAETLGSILEGYGYSCNVQTRPREALALAAVSSPKLFITDMKMPELSGMDVLEEMKRIAPHVPVVMVTGYGTINDAVTAMKNGAFDFIAKPYNIDHIAKVISRALKSSEPVPVDHGVEWEKSRKRFLTCFRQRLTEEMRIRIEMSALGQDSRNPVAIVGERATGKAAVAATIHELSVRSRQPLLTLDCERLDPAQQLLALVGSTGNDVAPGTKGILDVAAGGTVLINAVEKAHPHVLAALETLLRTGEYAPKGGAPRSSAARIIMTCNVRRSAGTAGLPPSLRPVVERQAIIVPPLRQRGDDVLAFAEFFLREATLRYGRENPAISAEVARALKRHDWPGNLHELENVIGRAAVMTPGSELTLAALPPEMQSLAEGAFGASGAPRTLKMLQVEQVRQTIARHDGDRNKAAAELGISLRTLYRKLSRGASRQRNTEG